MPRIAVFCIVLFACSSSLSSQGQIEIVLGAATTHINTVSLTVKGDRSGWASFQLLPGELHNKCRASVAKYRERLSARVKGAGNEPLEINFTQVPIPAPALYVLAFTSDQHGKSRASTVKSFTLKRKPDLYVCALDPSPAAEMVGRTASHSGVEKSVVQIKACSRAGCGAVGHGVYINGLGHVVTALRLVESAIDANGNVNAGSRIEVTDPGDSRVREYRPVDRPFPKTSGASEQLVMLRPVEKRDRTGFLNLVGKKVRLDLRSLWAVSKHAQPVTVVKGNSDSLIQYNCSECEDRKNYGAPIVDGSGLVWGIDVGESGGRRLAQRAHEIVAWIDAAEGSEE